MKELLEKYGIDVEITPENKDEIAAQIEAKIIEAKLNDEEFLKTIPLDKLPQYELAKKEQLTAGEMKALMPTKRAIISEFSLNDEEQKSITADFVKDQKGYIAQVKAIALGRAGNTGADLLKYQQIAADKEKEIEELRLSKETEINSVKLEYEGKLNEYTTQLYLKDINVRNFTDKLKLNAASLFEVVYPKIVQKYDIKIIDGVENVFQKGKDLKVPKLGKVGEFMSILDILESEYKLLDALKEDTHKTEPIKVPMGGDKKTNDKHIQAEKERERIRLEKLGK